MHMTPVLAAVARNSNGCSADDNADSPLAGRLAAVMRTIERQHTSTKQLISGAIVTHCTPGRKIVPRPLHSACLVHYVCGQQCLSANMCSFVSV